MCDRYFLIVVNTSSRSEGGWDGGREGGWRSDRYTIRLLITNYLHYHTRTTYGMQITGQKSMSNNRSQSYAEHSTLRTSQLTLN